MTSPLIAVADHLTSLGINSFSIGTSFNNGNVEFKTTVRADWQERYFQNDYLRIDPLPPVALYSRRPIRWSEVARMFPNNVVMQESLDFGITDGFALAHKGFVLSVADNTRFSGADIQFVYDEVTNLINKSPQRTLKLTKKQKGVLILMAAGLSVEEIAETNGVSTETIRSMKSRIFRALDVSKTSQAIGLIEYVVTGDADEHQM